MAELLNGGWQNAIGIHDVAQSSTTQLNLDFRYSRIDADWINNTLGTMGGLLQGASNAGGTMIWTPVADLGSPSGFDTIEIYTANFPGNGIITVQGNGVTIGTVNTSAASGTGKHVLTTAGDCLSFIGS